MNNKYKVGLDKWRINRCFYCKEFDTNPNGLLNFSTGFVESDIGPFNGRSIDGLDKIPLLSMSEELSLSKKYNCCKYMATKLGGIENARHCKKIVDLYLMSVAVRNELYLRNIRLIMVIARKYDIRGLLPDDLVAEGGLTMLKAVDYFDYNKGFRFCTYAGRAVAQWYSHIHSMANKRHSKFDSLDEYNDCRVYDNDNNLDDMELVSLLKSNMRYLTNSEKNVLIDWCNGSNNVEIGRDMKITKERVRQIKNEAVRKLRELTIHSA